MIYERIGKNTTLEARYLALINYCQVNPYTMRPRHLVSRFNLTEDQIFWIGSLLNLEILGFERKNTRDEIEWYLKDDPFITAEELSDLTGYGLFVIYSVGRKLGHTFQDRYTRRENETFGRFIADYQCQLF